MSLCFLRSSRRMQWIEALCYDPISPMALCSFTGIADMDRGRGIDSEEVVHVSGQEGIGRKSRGGLGGGDRGVSLHLWKSSLSPLLGQELSSVLAQKLAQTLSLAQKSAQKLSTSPKVLHQADAGTFIVIVTQVDATTRASRQALTRGQRVREPDRG